MEIDQIFREQLNSLHTISVEIASLRELPRVYDRALTYCLELTGSQLGFIGLVSKNGEYMDVAAVKGFTPSDPTFFDRYRVIPVRRSVFGVTIVDERPHVSNNVAADPDQCAVIDANTVNDAGSAADVAALAYGAAASNCFRSRPN